jgi:sulfatase modifying factor 1
VLRIGPTGPATWNWAYWAGSGEISGPQDVKVSGRNSPATKVSSALEGEVAIMKLSPIVLLFFAMLGCGSGNQTTNPSAESGGEQAQQQQPVIPEKHVATPAETAATAAVKKHMSPTQLALGDPITNSVGMVLVPIPADEFMMGSPDSDKAAGSHEKPQHLVKITKPFYLGVNEVTQQQYEKVMGASPWQGKDNVKEGSDYPAVYVSWNDAVEFCRKLSEQEGVEYRLPTEAQWEYTCRAGTTTIYSFGDDESKLGEHAWYRTNAWEIGEPYAHRVGQKPPNPWGLYDMHGNVFEWCQDWYRPYDSEKAVSDPGGPASGFGRVLRGGSFINEAAACRSAFRDLMLPVIQNSNVGFRVSRAYP